MGSSALGLARSGLFIGISSTSLQAEESPEAEAVYEDDEAFARALAGTLAGDAGNTQVPPTGTGVMQHQSTRLPLLSRGVRFLKEWFE